MLLSKHRDADVLFRLGHHMGFECVRGSTYGGATAALMELSRVGRQMHLAITPDGPRGPRRELARGLCFWLRGWGCQSCPWVWASTGRGA
jgi:lysophospholipid acyltransferase (LPLAT)-like uncharacterized protein